jgi:hypothetical protein
MSAENIEVIGAGRAGFDNGVHASETLSVPQETQSKKRERRHSRLPAAVRSLLVLLAVSPGLLAACKSSQVDSSCPTTPLGDVTGDGYVGKLDAVQTYGADILRTCPVFSDVTGSTETGGPDGDVEKDDVKFVAGAAMRSSVENHNNPNDMPESSLADVNGSGGPPDFHDFEIAFDHLGEKVPKGAFGLDNPGQLLTRYRPRYLVVGFDAPSPGIKGDDIQRIIEEDKNLLQEEGAQILQVDSPKLNRDGTLITENDIQPITISINTDNMGKNPDDLDRIAKELEESISDIGYVDK